ncbi:MAG: hypothetical protein M1821_009804 [Bathelium mastoideum]|nr:MAG: hypothetical protein M1821_009804 [Bathelium mastoideum]
MNSSFDTASMDTLQNVDQRNILDIVDKLRRSGLSSILKLPQIIVCGNQSSGKSSVLEAITEIPFPRKENLCTRFATEIILKRDEVSSITTTITPDKNRPQAEQQELQGFFKTVEDLSDFASLVEEATTLMGLDYTKREDNLEFDDSATKAFTRDVLRVEICGPDRPQLTLVDLPGIIQSASKAATNADVALINNLVKDYMANERTIILAIVSKYCRDLDPEGRRTLGIITKPDELREGSTNQKSWISLANNQEIYFKLGWHMLKNRSEETMHTSFQDRNNAERQFFSTGIYESLPRDMVGIESLRFRLSGLLYNHLKKELPGLRKELIEKLSATQNELSYFGAKRTTVTEQRQFLTAMSMEFYEIINSAVKGYYEEPFFGLIETEDAVDADSNIKRFRAIVKHLNFEFARSMRLRGHKYQLVEEPNGVSDPVNKLPTADEEYLKHPPHKVIDEISSSEASECESQLPKKMTSKEVEDWVLKILKRSRGRELPGNFNPMLIAHLFWEQSEPWQELAQKHIEALADKCSKFLRLVLESVAADDIRSRIWEHKIEPALEKALAASRVELGKILDDKKRHPITYNHYYTTTLQMKRNERFKSMMSEVFNTETGWARRGEQVHDTAPHISLAKLQEVIERIIICQDMDEFSVEQALDSQRAYYKDELKYFIGVVTKQVVERHLVDPLPATIISPPVVAGMSDAEVSFVTAEPEDVARRRAYLEEREQTLKKGQETFRQAMGGLY